MFGLWVSLFWVVIIFGKFVNLNNFIRIIEMNNKVFNDLNKIEVNYWK